MNTVLLQAAGGAGYESTIMMVGLVVVFYFFMIRPQMKNKKTIRNILSN
jgi:preprotein translocase subunit YajC